MVTLNSTVWILCAAAVMAIAAPVAGAQAQDPPKPAFPGLGSPKGPVSPDIRPEALWDGRKMVPFHALDMPRMVRASEADFLDPAEYVLGATVQGQSRAYPTRFVWWHHVVNDKITGVGKGDTLFAITYCSVCNTGVRYDLSVGGKPIRLDFYGLYNGVAVLCDRDTESVFLLAGGKFVTGPLMGKELASAPLLDTTWGAWRRLHPDTVVMAPDGAYSRYYRSRGQAEPRGYDRFPAPFFRPTVTTGDKRLPPFDKVLGVTVKAGEGQRRRAYPMRALTEAGGAVNDTVGGAPIVVFCDPATATAYAASRMVNARSLTFEARKGADGDVTFYDKETGTRWSIEGHGEQGPLAGKVLDPVDAHLSQWYGWYATFPETTIYGRTDAPQPGDPFSSPVDSAAPGPGEKKP